MVLLLFSLIVDTPSVSSSKTSRIMRTVSREVSMVVLFIAAARRMATPSP